MQKIVINQCFGGFGLSEDALSDLNLDSHWDLDRSDPRLVEVVERMGVKANGNHSELRVVEIPDGVEWTIHDYDGLESIHETHRSWF